MSSVGKNMRHNKRGGKDTRQTDGGGGTSKKNAQKHNSWAVSSM